MVYRGFDLEKVSDHRPAVDPDDPTVQHWMATSCDQVWFFGGPDSAASQYALKEFRKAAGVLVEYEIPMFMANLHDDPNCAPLSKNAGFIYSPDLKGDERPFVSRVGLVRRVAASPRPPGLGVQHMGVGAYDRDSFQAGRTPRYDYEIEWTEPD